MVLTSSLIQGVLSVYNNETYASSNNFNSIPNSPISIIGSIINWIFVFIAIYMSFKCNKGFNLASFLIAICFAPFYVLYRLAVPCINITKRNN
jgi:prolipoprotein diacylglyceryltransferase